MIEACLRQRGAFQPRLAQIRIGHVRAGQTRTAQICAPQARAGHARVAQIGPAQICQVQRRVGEIGADQIRGDQTRAGEIRIAHQRAAQVGLLGLVARQIAVVPVDPFGRQRGAVGALGRHCRCEHIGDDTERGDEQQQGTALRAARSGVHSTARVQNSAAQLAMAQHLGILVLPSVAVATPFATVRNHAFAVQPAVAAAPLVGAHAGCVQTLPTLLGIEVTHDLRNEMRQLRQPTPVLTIDAQFVAFADPSEQDVVTDLPLRKRTAHMPAAPRVPSMFSESRHCSLVWRAATFALPVRFAVQGRQFHSVSRLMVSPLPPTGPLPPAAAVTSTAPADTVSTWRVGQVLAATVVANPQPGQTELRIGNLVVRAQTGALELTAGQNLRLEVASLKEQPVLRLLGLSQPHPLTLAVRDSLPRQLPLAPLFAALARVTAAGSPPPLPPAVARIAREVFERLPDAATVATAPGLRQALRDSGLFLETKLARAPLPTEPPKPAPPSADTARDLKANLLRLIGALRENVATSAPATRSNVPASGAAATLAQGSMAASANVAAAARTPPPLPALDPGAPLQRGQPPLPPLTVARVLQAQELPPTVRELQRQAEGALARVQLNQLSSLPQERQPGMEWLIELPVRREQDADVWNLRILHHVGHDGGRNGEPAQGEDGSWSVMLAFDLPGIGPMQTRVNLRSDTITAQFFSRTTGTLALVQEHLPLLEARLRQAGLRIDELSCHHGQIQTAAAPQRTRLLDEHA